MKSIIIDTREPHFFAISHAEGAINIPSSEWTSGHIPEQLSATSKDTNIALYCFTGQRSNTCMQILKGHGFTNVANGANEQQVNRILAKR